MRVAIYTIALNEHRHATRWANTTTNADIRLVADTGSTDGTPETLRAAGVTVHQLSIGPWRFDTARNAALALVPADIDVCIVLDLDEVLSDGWRATLEAEWGTATRGRCHFVWNRNPDGTPGVTYQHDRIHQRHGYRWVHPCHETLVPDRIAEHVVDLGFEMEHLPDPTKSRGGYLELLQVATNETPDSARAAHYLGRELMYRQQWAAAEAELRRYLTLPDPGFPAERSATLRYLARSIARQGRLDDAINIARQATTITPAAREPWAELAQLYYDARRWGDCYRAATTALTITSRHGAHLNEDWAWNERCADLASVAAWHLGYLERAITHATDAHGINPHDERIAANLRFFQQQAA